MAAHFHSVPGRLRVHVPRVKGNVIAAREIETSISRLQGVARVESRELTGSVVVHYDPRAVDTSALLAEIGITAQPTRVLVKTSAAANTTSLPAKVTGKIARAVVWYIIEKAAERAIPLVIAAIL